jgi:hypothetical protein
VRDPQAYGDLRQRVARAAGEFSWRRTVGEFIALWQGTKKQSRPRADTEHDRVARTVIMKESVS